MSEGRLLSDPYTKTQAVPQTHLWTAEEDDYLRDAHDGTTATMRAIGEALGVPWYAVRERALALGLSNPPDVQPHPTTYSRKASAQLVKVASGADEAAAQPSPAHVVVASHESHQEEHQSTVTQRAKKQCPQCGQQFTPNSNTQRFCSRTCSGKFIGRQMEYHASPRPRKNMLAIPATEDGIATHREPRQEKRTEHASAPHVLTELLELLPPARTWTLGERERWMRAFEAMIDLLWTVCDGESEAAG